MDGRDRCGQELVVAVAEPLAGPVGLDDAVAGGVYDVDGVVDGVEAGWVPRLPLFGGRGLVR